MLVALRVGQLGVGNGGEGGPRVPFQTHTIIIIAPHCRMAVYAAYIGLLVMGGEQSQIKEREEPPQSLDQKIASCIENSRFKFSHQANVWKVCNRLRENYSSWSISEIHLDNNMIAGQAIEELTKINFEKSSLPLKALILSHNDILCDHLKYFRTAYLGTLVMLHLDHNKIGSDGCFYLSKTILPKLQTLDLSFNQINENGAMHLANANLPKLIHMIINNNKLTLNALVALSGAEWPSLALLQGRENLFEATIEIEGMKFRSEVKMFRLQLR